MKETNINRCAESADAHTARQFAAKFGKKPEWVRKLIKNNRIKAIKDFGSIKIPASEIDRIINLAEGGCNEG